MKENKGLQKITETPNTKEWLMGLKKVTYTELHLLEPNERHEALEIITKKINTLTGDELEKFLIQFDAVLDEVTKNHIWENNHLLITQYINNYINENGIMPNKTRIAFETKLSRNTVHKHFKEYKGSTVYKEQLEQFKIMHERIMEVIFKEAIRGNIKACRLYLEMIGGITKPNQKEVNTNNYIQINNTILNAEVIKGLNENQLKQIEQIIIGQKAFEKIN